MSDPIPWLCLAAALVGVLGLATAWTSGIGEDSIVLYVLMILGGGVGFLLLI